jgi:hypothetical protein
MFVSEVALGNVKEYYDAEDGPIEKKYNSTVGIGSQGPDPRYDVCLPTGKIGWLLKTLWIYVVAEEYVINSLRTNGDFWRDTEITPKTLRLSKHTVMTIH